MLRAGQPLRLWRGPRVLHRPGPGGL